MNIYASKLWLEDIQAVLGNLEDLKALEGENVLITGASGLICSSVTDILIQYNKIHHGNIQIYAAGRNEFKMKERFREYFCAPYFHFTPYDALRIEHGIKDSCKFIIHGASHSSPDQIMREPVETLAENFIGTKGLLDYARKVNAKRFVFVSSSEVYGKTRGQIELCEEDQGGISPLEVRNCYAIGKLSAESLCVAYDIEYNTESVIVRPGHVYGPVALEGDGHVSTIWTRNCARGTDIVMKSDGKQLRSYVYCLDCASAILKILLHGQRGNAYNISNPDSVFSVRQMAETLCKIGNIRLIEKSASEKEEQGFNPMKNSSLCAKKLEALGWVGRFDAQTGLERTVQIIKEIAQGNNT